MNTLDDTLNSFVARTAKSKVAVVVPMFGYWNSIQDNLLGLDTLRVTLDRVNSSHHQMYMFFVGEPHKVPDEIASELVVRMQAGNVQGVAAPLNGGYADYVREGLRVAMETTDAAYFIIINPWVLIQRIGIDTMVDRINFGDDARLISGFDLHSFIDAESTSFSTAFDNYFIQTPKENRMVDSNFMGISRYALEMNPPDENIKTAAFLEYDLWQQLHQKRTEAVATQRIPMFVFDVDFYGYENPEHIDQDKAYFLQKWKFLPELPSKLTRAKYKVNPMSNVNDDGTMKTEPVVQDVEVTAEAPIVINADPIAPEVPVETTNNTPADTFEEAVDEEGMVKHTITEEDLKNNPGLVEEGLSVGDEVLLPKGVMTRDEAKAAGIDVDEIEKTLPKDAEWDNGTKDTKKSKDATLNSKTVEDVKEPVSLG